MIDSVADFRAGCFGNAIINAEDLGGRRARRAVTIAADREWMPDDFLNDAEAMWPRGHDVDFDAAETKLLCAAHKLGYERIAKAIHL